RVGDEGTLEWLQTWLDQQTDFDRRKLVCKAIADIERNLATLDQQRQNELDDFCAVEEGVQP
ncbi:MAG: hypothetical protein AAGF58_05590, partial [Pseudomonadota bacterium]